MISYKSLDTKKNKTKKVLFYCTLPENHHFGESLLLLLACFHLSWVFENPCWFNRYRKQISILIEDHKNSDIIGYAILKPFSRNKKQYLHYLEAIILI
jgi:hypothetical protein